ncbi:hypothetical protein K431DRAFT_288242 [Polychaeton citri CBS 116435]|uniref:t-SNARE coiled-coil homology domain-containing protein n=1 Tax=Polychaeton citri CBS 116435 TaxID=1314669 RepID=A0A9P4Q1K4_9PEZI|nr:hypothetical protein K431DRAFT_288242 [Polychaeton citri CBS 116435]
MASRFHNQRDARSALFSSYPDGSSTRSRPASSAASASPAPRPTSRNSQLYGAYPVGASGPYGAGAQYNGSSSYLSTEPPNSGGFSAYPSANGGDVPGRKSGDSGFRAGTPNNKGQYSAAVLDELESQNDDQVSEMTKKVRMLKDLSSAIGVEIRDSTAFAEKMNDSFEGTRNRLRGTMNRMLRMADRTGVGWRVWLGFFTFIFLLFTYVWLR